LVTQAQSQKQELKENRNKRQSLLTLCEDSLVDNALANWGRFGWELASVVSHNGYLMAFFKRPMPAYYK